MISKKILITGGSGYIGNYITKIMAATRPECLIYSMSRKPAEEAQKKDPQTARFQNVRFLQGNVLKPESYPSEVKEVDSVIHTVGQLIEGANYQQFLRKGLSGIDLKNLDPLAVYNSLRGMQTPNYEESHEAVNRDSCKMIAEYFNNECGKRGNKGHFVFFSAAQSLVPMLSRYIEMKRQAEDYLLSQCPNLEVVILRPGFVYHPSERSWSTPVGLATDLGYQVNKKIISQLPANEIVQPLLPQAGSIHLGLLAEHAIKAALGEYEKTNQERIWTNEMMNKSN